MCQFVSSALKDKNSILFLSLTFEARKRIFAISIENGYFGESNITLKLGHILIFQSQSFIRKKRMERRFFIVVLLTTKDVKYCHQLLLKNETFIRSIATVQLAKKEYFQWTV